MGFDEDLETFKNKVSSPEYISENEDATYTQTVFESIKHINEFGQEFWYARELSKVLEYKDFHNFELIIFKAMDSCQNSGNIISDHFGETTEMVTIGSGAKRNLRRYDDDIIDNDDEWK